MPIAARSQTAFARRGLFATCGSFDAVNESLGEPGSVLHQAVGTLESDDGLIPIQLLAEHSSVVDIEADGAIAQLLDYLSSHGFFVDRCQWLASNGE